MPFGSKEGGSSNELLGELSKRLNDNMRRIRVIEETLRSINMRTNEIEERLINEIKKINELSGNFDSNIKELNTKTSNIIIEIEEIKKDMTKLVKRSELKEIETYLELIRPMTSKYITKKEVEVLFKEKGL